MEKPRLIRYLENGEYKYPSVKDVGDLNVLKTTAKEDIVSAINEIFITGGSGGGTIPPDLADRIDRIENDNTLQDRVIAGQGDLITSVKTDYELSKSDIVLLKKIQEQVVLNVTNVTAKADRLENDLATTAGKYDEVKQGLLNKVDINKYNTEYSSIVQGLNDKVGSLEFGTLTGKVSKVENDIVAMEGELSTKVTSTEFDDAVGVNKWISSRYPITGTDLGQTPPSFSLIRGMQAIEVKDIEDATILPVFAGTGQITHFFTNVYLKTAKTIALNVVYDDSLAVYMNGASVFENKFNNMASSPISLSLRQGWNTIEILHGQHNGIPVLNLGATISSQVDRMTTVIGVGDKNETRFTQAETLIKQTSDSILLKADKTVVENIGNKVTEQGSSIELLNQSITSKVGRTEFDAYAQKVTTSESQILQLSDKISQTVTKKEYDALNQIVSSQETKITQLSSDISLKVDVQTYNGLKGQVESAVTQINLNKEAILLKASNEQLSSVTGRLTTAEGQIKIANEQILLKVSKTDFDVLAGRVSTAESEIDQTSEQIALRVTKNELDTAITGAKSEIKLTTDGISQSVSNISKTVGEQGTTISSHTASISTMKDQISSKVSKTEVTDAVGAIKIGGANLLPNSSAEDMADGSLVGWGAFGLGTNLIQDTGRVNGYSAKITAGANNAGFTTPSTQVGSISGGKEYTVSLWMKVSVDCNIGHVMKFYNATNVESSLGSKSYVVKANTWTKLEDTFVAPADSVRMCTTPRVVSGYASTPINVWVDEVKFEEGNKATSWSPSNDDISVTLTGLSIRISEAEQIIESDSIISTVTSSETFNNLLDEKANTDSLANFPTNEQLTDELDKMGLDVDGKIKNGIDNIDLETYQKFTSLKQTSDAFAMNFTSAGGVNLIKNSVGFAGFDFWSVVDNGLRVVSHQALESLGFGSGFNFSPMPAKERNLYQNVDVVAGRSYTFSWHVNKTNKSPSTDSMGALYFQFLTEDGNTVLKENRYKSEETTNGYEEKFITYTPTYTGKMRVRIYAYGLVDATVTGLMLNVGARPLQWTMAHGEIYNSSVRFDMKGIRVSKIEDAKESRFTIMTPDKFAGYYDVNGDGIIDSSDNSPDEVFKMNDDEFVMKKSVIKEEIAMDSMKVIKINTSANKGWAFIPADFY